MGWIRQESGGRLWGGFPGVGVGVGGVLLQLVQPGLWDDPFETWKISHVVIGSIYNLEESDPQDSIPLSILLSLTLLFLPTLRDSRRGIFGLFVYISSCWLKSPETSQAWKHTRMIVSTPSSWPGRDYVRGLSFSRRRYRCRSHHNLRAPLVHYGLERDKAGEHHPQVCGQGAVHKIRSTFTPLFLLRLMFLFSLLLGLFAYLY